jgi:hypothetical protein
VKQSEPLSSSCQAAQVIFASRRGVAKVLMRRPCQTGSHASFTLARLLLAQPQEDEGPH